MHLCIGTNFIVILVEHEYFFSHRMRLIYWQFVVWIHRKIQTSRLDHWLLDPKSAIYLKEIYGKSQPNQTRPNRAEQFPRNKFYYNFFFNYQNSFKCWISSGSVPILHWSKSNIFIQTSFLENKGIFILKTFSSSSENTKISRFLGRYFNSDI